MSDDQVPSALAVLVGIVLTGLGALTGVLLVLSFRAYFQADDGIALVRGIVLLVPTWALLVLGISALRGPPRDDPVTAVRWRRRRVWAGLALGMCVLPALFLTVVPLHGRSQDAVRMTTCANHQRQIATLLGDRARTGGWPAHGGKAFVLSLVADGVLDIERRENLELLFCPACGTPEFEREMTRAYAGLTAENLHRTYLNALTVYAGRRNDEPAYALGSAAGEGGSEPILACLCHRRGALVAFLDGSVRFLEREELGLGPDDPIAVGEASASPILRKLSDE